MALMSRIWRAIGLLAGVVLLAWILYHPGRRPELTVATVNNADMILMQQLSSEFEKQSGVKLNWVVLGENILRQRSDDRYFHGKQHLRCYYHRFV